ncbi:hypothetical protein PSTT_16820 [Puccinia striiformis]|uniref:DDE Tnp4 domain-containing protein n=1 Tax=Puccinia striiformis TaxID=27350 RepID=A0A2S4UB35_9BASI|nr:hypothetical protein PSTT_16820 [Puccinia striiformis]
MASWSLIEWSRYHLREQGPANPKELFNLQHTTLRNAVERTFGAWKKRFPILTHALDYNLGTQQDLVFALASFIDHSRTLGDHFLIGMNQRNQQVKMREMRSHQKINRCKSLAARRSCLPNGVMTLHKRFGNKIKDILLRTPWARNQET